MWFMIHILTQEQICHGFHLTRAADIIESHTYDTFFPLIITALIYFLMTTALISVLKAVEIRTDPMKRKREPKGVKV